MIRQRAPRLPAAIVWLVLAGLVPIAAEQPTEREMSVEALLRRAARLAQAKQPEEARRTLDRAWEASSTNIERARVRLAQGDLAREVGGLPLEGRGSFSLRHELGIDSAALLADSPGSASTRSAVGQVLEQQASRLESSLEPSTGERVTDAESFYINAIELAADDPVTCAIAVNNLAVIWIEAERWESAVELLERYLDILPDVARPRYLYNYGLALEGARRLPAAVAAYTGAAVSQPDFAEPYKAVIRLADQSHLPCSAPLALELVQSAREAGELVQAEALLKTFVQHSAWFDQPVYDGLLDELLLALGFSRLGTEQLENTWIPLLDPLRSDLPEATSAKIEGIGLALSLSNPARTGDPWDAWQRTPAERRRFSIFLKRLGDRDFYQDRWAAALGRYRAAWNVDLRYLDAATYMLNVLAVGPRELDPNGLLASTAFHALRSLDFADPESELAGTFQIAGQALERRNRKDEAIVAWARALELNDDASVIRPELESQIASAQRDLSEQGSGRFAFCTANTESTRQQLQALRNKRTRGFRLLRKGYVLLCRDRYSEAETRFKRALVKFRKEENSFGSLSAYEGLGDVEHARGDIDAAVSLYRQAESYGRPQLSEAQQRLQGKYQELEDGAYLRFINPSPDRWETYDAFVRQYPKNHNRAEALRLRDALQYASYREHGTLEEIVAFLDLFPDNRYAGDALEKVYSEWRRWGSEDPLTALAAYDRFLEAHPDSRLRAAAEILHAYYSALTDQTLEGFEKFYQLFEEAGATIPLLDAPALARLAEGLEQAVDDSPTARGFVLLHERTGQGRYLERARDLVSSSEEEAYLVQLDPYAYFEIGEATNRARARNAETIEYLVELTREEGIAGALIGLYVPKSETTIEPVLDLPIRSRTKYASCALELDFELEMEVEGTATGLLVELGSVFSDQPTSQTRRETYKSRARVELKPRSYDTVELTFDEVRGNIQQSFAGLAGVETQRQVESLSFKLRSVTWNDGDEPQIWHPALDGRELNDFRRAARSFNELVERSRSGQIDQIENIARDGILDHLFGGGG